MRPSSTLDHYHLFNIFRKNTGIPQRNAASERMGNDRKWCEALLMDQLSEIIQVARMAIASAHYMGRITMASEVGRDDMKSVPKSLRDPVPIVTVVTVAMHKQRWWRLWVAPVQIMETETLTIVRVRSGSGSC